MYRTSDSLPEIVDLTKIKGVYVQGIVGREFRDENAVKQVAIDLAHRWWNKRYPVESLTVRKMVYTVVKDHGLEGYLCLVVVEDKL